MLYVVTLSINFTQHAGKDSLAAYTEYSQALHNRKHEASVVETDDRATYAHLFTEVA